MVLATAKIGDFDQFWNTFSTKGAEKRKQHGCKGSHVFRDPNESDRAWAIFDWDEAGWQSFTSDPDVRDLSGSWLYAGPPKSAEFLRQHDVSHQTRNRPGCEVSVSPSATQSDRLKQRGCKQWGRAPAAPRRARTRSFGSVRFR